DEFSINNNKVNILRYDTFADSLEYYPGQKVYVFGFPGAVGPEYWTKSILREGIVSWVNAKKPHKVPFLIDCDVFPGNSGGPVLSVPYGISRKGTILDGGNISFMGIVSQRRLGHNLIMDSKGNIIQDIKGTRLVSYESIGVGVVEPAYRVKELLKHIEKEIK
ncbi:MAG: trypsin-like peptidase domain-containing protein, partial [Bacteroidales bacterium]|nr:trypsin-like peptidase domain-containing protein [Bacteroidales bacterium]